MENKWKKLTFSELGEMFPLPSSLKQDMMIETACV